ncbi:hypothetical protein [Paenibacillus sp. NPDC055715]
MDFSTPAICQMMDVYEATGKQVVGVRTVEEQGIRKYVINWRICLQSQHNPSCHFTGALYLLIVWAI